MNILISGAGPTGLTAAVELARRGIMPRIIDRKAEASTLSRAVGINPHTLHLLEASGVTPRLIAKGIKLQRAFLHDGDKKILTLHAELFPRPYDFLLSLPQDETEKILQQRFEELGGHVEYNTEVTELKLTPDNKAQVSIGRETMAADIVIAADGAHSLIRQASGIAFNGHDYPVKWGIADVDVTDFPYEENTAHLFIHDGRIGFILPIGDHRYRAVASQEDAIAAIPNLAPHVKNIRNKNAFQISVRQAETYQKGPLFLAGDAAHTHSPAGGLGMNTGIADACTLARLIVENKTADYTALRHPVGKQVLATSETLVFMAGLKNPVLKALRNALFSLLNHMPLLQKPILARIAGGGGKA